MTNRNVKELKYSEAEAELQQILQQMQSNNCNIDQLTAMTRRASELLKECRERLTATKEELDTILSQLEK